MASIDRGGVAALAGVALLAAIIGWRASGAEDGEGAAVADSSLPPTLEELAERAAADPDNPAGWHELGFNLFDAGRFEEAADAFERAVEADATSAVVWASLGEARVMASESDPMPDAARQAFRRAVAIDPGEPRARYFLAVDRDLSGDHEGAIADWLALLADTPPSAPWESDLVRTIEQVGAINSIAVGERIASASAARDILPAGITRTGPGPTREQMTAAAALPSGEQQDMAEGMVARLAARIESEGGSVEEWIMLMRSYDQLGRMGDARRAREAAIAAHPGAREKIESSANSLGIG